MPRQQFLKNDEKLSKNNILRISKALKDRATRQIDNNQLEVNQYFDDIERRIEFDKLQLLVNLLGNKMSENRSNALIDALGYNRHDLKMNAMTNYRDLVKDYMPDGANKRELIAFIDSAKNNDSISIKTVSERVKNSLPLEHQSKVFTNDICFVPVSVLLRRFDDFIVILQVELSNDEIESIGDSVNNFKSKYEYKLGDNITKPLYSDETAELIGYLNTNKKIDGIDLNEIDIREYEEALMRANELFGEPTIDLDIIASRKTDLDKAIDHDQQKNSDEVIKEMGLDPKVIKSSYSPVNGPYYEVLDNKRDEFNSLKDNIEIELPLDTKQGIKEILTKIHEYGYDKDGILGEQKNKIYGLKPLYEAGLKYKEAIKSENLEDRIKAIKYAKEVYEADKKIKSLFELIDKYMPISLDNLSYPGNVDSMRTEGMPPEYRMDYIRASHLANLYSLANMIEEKKWDIDDFLDRPMFYLKQYYKDDYLAKVNPSSMNEGLTGDDLIFNIGRNSLTSNLDNMLIGGGRIVEGIVDSIKDRETRNKNAAMSKAFNETIFEPYSIANGFREYVAKNKHLDMILINPNLTFKDLRLATFNPDELKFEEPDNERFDEISYIKERKEPLSAIKNRIELSILKYMKNEIELVTRNKEAGVMYLSSQGFVDLCQKAVAKILVLRRDEKDTQAYEELEAFVNNKQMYVHALVNEINEDGKFKDYMIVKNISSNPPTYDNSIYNPTSFDNGNNYKNTIENYDKYVKDNKIIVNHQAAGFINNQKSINENINKALQTYNNLERKYETEVKKLYGENYKGKIDNARSDKLLDLFRLKTDAYKKFILVKASALDGILEEVKKGSIPISYLEDRKLQVENNIFNEIPPLFRSDKLYTMDEYVKLKHPEDYSTLSEADKETIYNTYKRTILRDEADFFARKYLISNGLTDEKADTIEIQEFEREEVEYGELNENVLEAQLIGVPVDAIISNNIGQKDSKFDEIRFLRQNNKQIAEYKKFMDKNLIELIKSYTNNEEIGALPNINKSLDVFQKSALKYLLTVGYVDKASKEYKDLNEFLVDGKGYINKLIEEENKNIEQRNLKSVELQQQEFEANHQEDGVINELVFEGLEDKITIDANSLGVTDEAINNYSNIMTEFDAYYKEKVKTNFFKLPPEIEAEENNANSILMQEYANLKNSRFQNNNSLLEDNDFDALEDYKLEVRDRIFNYFKQGLISEDYLNERYRRLDNNDFKLPKFFTIDKMRSRDDYILSKYPYEYHNLTKDEKNQIYNRYKDECEANRRQFILRKFMVEKGLSEFVTPTLATFEKIGNQYKPNQVDNPTNLFKKNSNKNGIEEKEQIEIFEKYSPKKKDSVKLSIFDESEEERDRKEQMRFNYTFKKWNLNLLDILKEKMGDEIYKEEQIESRFSFDRETDSSLYWIDTKCNSLKQMLGNDIQNVFKEAADRLSQKDKQILTKKVQEDKAYAEYFPSLFKKEKENELFSDRIIESLNEEKDLDNDIIITNIDENEKIIDK